MKKIVVAVAAVVLIGVIVTAAQGHKKSPQSNAARSSSTATTTDTRPGVLLAAEDHASAKSELYQLTYDNLDSHCSDASALRGYVDFAYSDLNNNGVHDETRLSIMAHLNASIPHAGGVVNCRALTAAYLVLREPK